MLGSMVGGYMAEPEGRIPILGSIGLYQYRPYIAPGQVMGLLTMICALTIWLVVPEVS
jgi:hypothetical protein